MSLIDTLYSALSDAYLYPAMAQGFLDSAGKSAMDIAADLASNCVSLARKEDLSKNRVPLHEWIIEAVNSGGRYSIAFFGRSVYGGPSCDSSDLEAVLFVPENENAIAYRLSSHPSIVTLLKVYESRYAFPGFPEHDLSYLFAGPVLLYPSAPHGFAIQRIDSARRHFGGSDEEDALMARITHAASKVLNNQELGLFDSSEAASRLIGRCLTAKDAVMFFDFGEKPDLSAVNQTYEKQLKAIPAEDLSALAKAAMKRIRVKEEHRERLAKKYVDRLMRFK